MSQYQDLKQRVYECNMELPRQDVVIYTFGNASEIDREAGVFAIKPSGVDYESLKPEDIVIVDMDGHIVEGDMRPSSDTNTHLVLYKAYPNIGGVVHTHSTYAVAWSQAAKPIPIMGTTHADHLHTDVPCTDFMSEEMIKGDYEIETGNQIVKAVADQNINPDEVPMVLVAGHGPFTWGKNGEKAVYHSVVLEELAKMALMTLQVNPRTQQLPDALIQKHYMRKHGPNAYYGQK
jgi:L-ribulose-5-phosphate 4-epimerase